MNSVVKTMSGNQVNVPAGQIMSEITTFEFPPAAAQSVVMMVVVIVFVASVLRMVDIRKELAP